MVFIYDAFFSRITEFFQETLMKIAEFFIDLVLKSNVDFWGNPIIGVLLDFTQWVNFLVLSVALLFLLVDIAEEQIGHRPVEWSIVFGNFIKAIIFIVTSRWIALLSMELADLLVASFRIDGDNSTIQEAFNQISFMSTNTVTLILLHLFALIVTAIFLFVVLIRYGLMLVQILTSPFYVADIVRGDTTKMGDWLRQTVAIAGTYVFQYVLYYLGLLALANGNTISAICTWGAITMVSRILQRHGFSTGTKGVISSAGMMAGQSLVRFGIK